MPLEKEIDFLKSLPTKAHKPLKQKLYHAIRYDYLLDAMNKDCLDPFTIQFSWKDGLDKNDDHPDFQKDRLILKGWSLTRDLNFAMQWGGDVTLEFDRDELLTHFKIKPLAWHDGISKIERKIPKKEREEFLIASSDMLQLHELLAIEDEKWAKVREMQDKCDAMSDDNYEIPKQYVEEFLKMQKEIEALSSLPSAMDIYSGAHGQTLSLSKYCKKIHINPKLLKALDEREGEREAFQKLLDHPLFKKINGSLVDKKKKKKMVR